MRAVASILLLFLVLAVAADPASAQWRWNDGRPEWVGPPMQRSPSYGNQAPWGRDAWGGDPWGRDRSGASRLDPSWPFGAPLRQPGGEEVRSGGARPDIAPSAPPVVAFPYPYAASSIVIDSEGRRLYYVLPDQRAYAYQIAVGREGFDWTGTEVVSRKQAWPDWHPPPEMRARDPSLPVKMTGGLNNPLGAMALYLGTTLYRIHGTNEERSLGQAGSSGCFRMMNANVLHLAALVEVGTVVHVVQSLEPARVSGAGRAAQPRSADSRPWPPAQPPPRTRRDTWQDWDRARDYQRDWRYGGWRW